jgi:carbonic anhydrase/acetyltransferase-like protein (isoleucine patch superfamily)
MLRRLMIWRDAPVRRGTRIGLTMEGLESRLALSSVHALHAPLLPVAGEFVRLVPAHRPVAVPLGDLAEASFVDPTAVIVGGGQVAIAGESYVGPFATLIAGRNGIVIGHGSNLQDNTTVDARRGAVVIGDNAPIAHGATVIGPATIGASGGRPAFVSFNAVIDRATLEPDTVVSGLARVGPGVVIHSGTKVLPGKFVRTQAEADDPALGKVTAVTNEDRAFVAEVLEVNTHLASGYAALYFQSPRLVHGIGPNPDNAFNPGETLPVLAGLPTSAPHFRGRIVGKVTLTDTLAGLKLVLGHGDAIRADEGSPFLFGPFGRVANRVTFHALVGSGITLGSNDSFGFHSLIHGGPDIPNPPAETTTLGNNVSVGAYAVVYRSHIGDNVVIGAKSYIERSTIAPGTIIPPGTVMILDQVVGTVQW